MVYTHLQAFLHRVLRKKMGPGQETREGLPCDTGLKARRSHHSRKGRKSPRQFSSMEQKAEGFSINSSI